MHSLDSIDPGHYAVVTQVRAHGALLHRLAALGLREGNILCVVRRAHLGGPIHVRIGTTELFLRRGDARHVEVRRLQALGSGVAVSSTHTTQA